MHGVFCRSFNGYNNNGNNNNWNNSNNYFGFRASV